MEQWEGLITLPKLLFLYNVWVVPAGMEAEARLTEPLKRLPLIESPNEHVIQVSYNEEGLPNSAAKPL